MQPLFAHNPPLLRVLVVSYLIWALMEVSVGIRQRKRLRAYVSRQDKGSHMVIGGMIQLGNALCVLLALTVPATAITSAREILFWLQEHLGQRYQEYMRRTKRLIPFVL